MHPTLAIDVDGPTNNAQSSATEQQAHGRPNLQLMTNLSSMSGSVTPVASPRRLSTMTSPGQSNTGINPLASPRKVANNVSTFKLANAVLGVIGTPCTSKSEPAFQLALDNAQRTVSVSSSSTEGPGAMHYARHLAAIHTISADPTDRKRITITFRDGRGGIDKAMLKIYAMTLSEARMIDELLALMMEDYEEPRPDGALDDYRPSMPAPEREIADTDIIYVGRCLKRGKMSWAPRWLVLKKFHLRVYKTNKLHVPSNNISLSGAKITTNDEKEKHLTLICMDRSYTFKFCDQIERDNVQSLFQKAMELRTRADGSLALSSIGGANPAPSHTGSLIGSFNQAAFSQDADSIPNTRQGSFHLLPGMEDARSRRQTVPTRWEGFQSQGGANGSTSFPTGRAPAASVSFRPDQTMMNANSDQVSELPSVVAKRRKSRRTISRDFQNILCKPTHALAIDETSSSYTSAGGLTGFGSSGTFGGGGSTARPAKRIEFAEFEIDVEAAKAMERPNKQLNHGVYTFMRQLGDSISGGAHLSSTLYVPKTVWYQHGAKFQAFQVKMDVLESLRVPLLSVLPPKAVDIAPASTAATAGSSTRSPASLSQTHIAEELERALSHFRVTSEEAQDKLAQHLSFIHTVKDPFRHRGKSLAVSGGSNAGYPTNSATLNANSSSSASSSISPEGGSTTTSTTTEKLTLSEKLSKSMKTFGKIVSRAASSTKDKVDHEDSTRYVKLLASIFDQSQVFHEWILFLETGMVGPGAAQVANQGGTGYSAIAVPVDMPHAPIAPSPPDLPNRAILEDHLARISEFFYFVICNMVIRDLKSVLKRYIKHCIRTLAAH